MPRRHAARFYAAVALGVTAVAAVLLLRRPRPTTGSEPARPSDAALTDWCAEGLEPIGGGGCFAAPPTTRANALLVYLHGRYPPDGLRDELERQARVARMGTARGYAVLALRGSQGQCTDPELATWWCWPSNERNAADGPAFVARWSEAFAESERRIGKSRHVLLGFSNGAYFAALIASRELHPFDAVAIAHGGPVEPMRAVGSMPPLLLVDADDDPSGLEMDRLEAALTREAWPHVMVAREGGHALPEWDVEMALTFFERTKGGKLPRAQLATRARRLHQAVDDASADQGQGASASPDAGASPGASASPDTDE